MSDVLTAEASSPAARKRRLAVAAKILEIEGNPLTGADLRMFEMFEREGYTPEECRAHILQQFTRSPAFAE